MAALLQRSDRCQHCGVRAVQPPLNQQILDAVGIPLPPIGEQREIVRRVDALFALAEGIEDRIRVATVLAERLPSAISRVPSEASWSPPKPNSLPRKAATSSRRRYCWNGSKNHASRPSPPSADVEAMHEFRFRTSPTSQMSELSKQFAVAPRAREPHWQPTCATVRFQLPSTAATSAQLRSSSLWSVFPRDKSP